MLLADLGAEVIRVDAPEAVRSPLLRGPDALARSRRSVVVDLKCEAGVEVVMRLVESADVFTEGFRPGVAERLGIGPEECLARNHRLVYARVTGWGQDGPLAHAAGHDLDYIALAGVLHPIGRAGGAPVPPLNLIGDFGGGGMLLALGVLAALFERSRSGQGQVVDAAMVDGAALLATAIFGARATGHWNDERGTNMGDTGAHFYETYETSDGEYVAIAAVEPKFYAELLERIGVDGATLPPQLDARGWPAAKAVLADVFRRRSRAEWCDLLEGTDACFAPVLSLVEAPEHPHNRARGTFVDVGEMCLPAPAPRFSRTPPELPDPPRAVGEGADETLAAWGFAAAEISSLRSAGALG
jgi:alpha-methylacyl-CoA racemase